MQQFRLKAAQTLAQCPVFIEAQLTPAAIVPLFSTPPKAELGDLSIPLFVAAKALKLAPPAAAARAVVELRDLSIGQPGSLIREARAAGPYLNLYFDHAELARSVLASVVEQSPGDDPAQWTYGCNHDGDGKTLVIDMSSPNIAKPLAVHHLRSTMIGNSIRRLYEACGWRVVALNYLGDWGTGFGKLIAGWCRAHPDVAMAIDADPTEANAAILFASVTITELNACYVDFNRQIKNDSSLETLGAEEFAALEAAILAKSPEGISPRGRRNLLIWKQIKRISLAEFERVYAMLGLGFTPWPLPAGSTPGATPGEQRAFFSRTGIYLGESFGISDGDLSHVVFDQAQTSGVLAESDGAQVIFTDGPDKPPLILLKSDGATSYHTRDLASALYRRSTFQMDKAIYVVGNEQSLHFHQLFRALEMLGNAWAGECQHVGFGLYLAKNEEGKWMKFSTRAGRSALLHDLLQDATDAVKAIIAEKNPALSADQTRLNSIAEAVGVGAVVFNDLKNGRNSDVKFEWDDMLSFNGETGPYMLYQYVRLGSVRRKFDARYGSGTTDATGWPTGADASLLTLPQERELLKAIASFPETVARAAREAEPSTVSRYLLDLSGLFSTYWAATRDEGIVGDNCALSTARIALVEAVRRVLGKGLTLLGLRLVDEM
jgi:arginyl-tRNA synthetase